MFPQVEGDSWDYRRSPLLRHFHASEAMSSVLQPAIGIANRMLWVEGRLLVLHNAEVTEVHNQQFIQGLRHRRGHHPSLELLQAGDDPPKISRR
jgi:hypothetical protein